MSVVQICADTVVGDAMLRGISGGQKKRVTTAEMIVGPKKTLFLDEISTGLVSVLLSTYGVLLQAEFRKSSLVMGRYPMHTHPFLDYSVMD